jgi:hypothetical protein
MMTAGGSTDKRFKRKAEDCDWYLLATVYGEPGQPEYDHAKNRIFMESICISASH